jgi:hypothetical protein
VIRKGPGGGAEARPGLLAPCDDGEGRTGSVAAGAVVEVVEMVFA